jgi:hypothetical protein
MTTNTAAYFATLMQGFNPAVQNHMLSLFTPAVSKTIERDLARDPKGNPQK